MTNPRLQAARKAVIETRDALSKIPIPTSVTPTDIDKPYFIAAILWEQAKAEWEAACKEHDHG